MKSVFSIVKNLSDKEIRNFRRLFLSGKKGGESSKKELFDTIVKSTNPSDVRKLISKQHYSRQNYYQLCKRLRENLYDFLFSFHESNKDNERFAEEMECHKKLYCVKVLIDRNMKEEAQQVLDEAIATSDRHQLSSIYLEASNLKHKLFPFTKTHGSSDSGQGFVKDVKDSYSISEYIRKYLIESVTGSHESDREFRQSLFKLDGHGDNPTVSRLQETNHLFYEKDFKGAYDALRVTLDGLRCSGLHTDGFMKGLLLVELAKCCLCLKNYGETESYLSQAEEDLHYLDYWMAIISELRYVGAIRSQNEKAMSVALDDQKKINVPGDKGRYETRWNLYLAWYHYQNHDLRKVIKMANSKKSLSQNGQKDQVVLKLLELICIYQLNDPDWLHYKCEALRKQLQGRADVSVRVQVLFGFIKKYLHSNDDSGILEKLKSLEQHCPWHPLSDEVLNITDLIGSLVSTGHWRLASCH